jgi:glycosyltransferase involved in cell wall biosynthesis
MALESTQEPAAPASEPASATGAGPPAASELAAMRAVLARERDRAERLEERLREAEGALDELRASTAWRAAQTYYRIRDSVPALRLAHRAARRLRARVGALRAAPLAVASSLLPRGGAGELTGLTLGRRGRVSVVLPVFDQASMLTESIESVLAQTHRDLELIVVNDGSTDGVEAVLERYADHPLVIVLTQPNQKLPSALNNGFAIATGEYFTWTSADNAMLPRQLEVLVRHLERHPEHALVCSDYQAIDAAGRPLRDPTFRPQNQDPRDPSRMRLPRRLTLESLFHSGDNHVGASFLYRRDAARLVGPYAEDTFGGEDYDYWLRLLALFGAGHVDEVLYLYRVHANTLNARAREVRIAESVRRLLARHAARLEALARPPLWLAPGLTIPGVPAAERPDEAGVVAYASSRGDAIARETPGSLAVCVVDQPLEELDEEALASADLILAEDATVQAYLGRRLPHRALRVDLRRDGPLLARVAALRAFERRAVPAARQPPARIFPVGAPLRVGLQVDALDRGGLEQVVTDLARNLDPARVRPTLLVHARDLGAAGGALKAEGIEVVTTGGDERALLGVVEARGLQVINTHHSVAGLAGYHARGVATVYTVHSSYVWMDELERASRAAALRSADLFLPVSRQVERYFEQRFRVDPRRVRFVPNGLDPRDLAGVAPASRAALGLSPGDFVFLQVGSFSPAKLQGVVVEAFRRLAADLPAAHLLLVGNAFDRTYHQAVLAAIRRDGLDERVHVLGWRSRREVAGLYQIADCFVLPSLVEGWSLAVNEALHFGLPLVLTDVGSAREVIRGGDVGIVVPNPYRRLGDLDPGELRRLAERYPEANLEALAAAMRDIATRREAWRARAAAGRAKVTGPLHIRSMATAYADAYEEAFRRFRKPAAR